MVRKAKVSLAFILSLQNLKSLLGDNVIAEMTKHATVFPKPDVPIMVKGEREKM